MDFSYFSHVKLNDVGDGEIITFNNKIFLKYSDQFTSEILKNFVRKNEHDTTILKKKPLGLRWIRVKQFLLNIEKNYNNNFAQKSLDLR